jgi:hypothetical protein
MSIPPEITGAAANVTTWFVPIVSAVVVPLVWKTSWPVVSPLEIRAVPLVVPAEMVLIYRSLKHNPALTAGNRNCNP